MDRGFMNNLSDPAEGAGARHDWTVQKASQLFHARRFEWNPFAGVTTETGHLSCRRVAGQRRAGSPTPQLGPELHNLNLHQRINLPRMHLVLRSHHAKRPLASRQRRAIRLRNDAGSIIRR